MSFVDAYNVLMRERPKLFVAADDAGNPHQLEIIDEAHKLMKANPGMERETAHLLLMQKRPELFRDPSVIKSPADRLWWLVCTRRDSNTQPSDP
jgi:hypothetical protein